MVSRITFFPNLHPINICLYIIAICLLFAFQSFTAPQNVHFLSLGIDKSALKLVPIYKFISTAVLAIKAMVLLSALEVFEPIHYPKHVSGIFPMMLLRPFYCWPIYASMHINKYSELSLNISIQYPPTGIPNQVVGFLSYWF